MGKLSHNCGLLSDRILILGSTFRDAYESGQGLDHQQAKTFMALLDESYEDAVLLEGAATVRTGRQTADILQFPKPPVCVVDNSGGRD